MTASSYPRRDDGPGRPRVDAGRLWMGGLASALVAALVALVGVVIARGLFDVPVLAPTGKGTLGDASTARLAVLVAVLAPFTTDADLDTKVATAAITLAIGLAIGSLVPGVARSAIRQGSGWPPPYGSSPA